VKNALTCWGTCRPRKAPAIGCLKPCRAIGRHNALGLKQLVRRQEDIPPEAVAMAVSLDGVMAPMKDGPRLAPRTQARARGKAPSGPAGSQEVGGATVSYDDRHGERLCTRRMARMPEPTQATLKGQLTAAVMGALIRRPD